MRVYVVMWYETVIWAGTDEAEARRVAAERECCVTIWEDGEEVG